MSIPQDVEIAIEDYKTEVGKVAGMFNHVSGDAGVSPWPEILVDPPEVGGT